MSLVLEELNNDTDTPPTLKARSLAAFATTIRLTQEVARKALNVDLHQRDIDHESLPELTIREMTDKEIKKITKAAESGGILSPP